MSLTKTKRVLSHDLAQICPTDLAASRKALRAASRSAVDTMESIQAKATALHVERQRQSAGIAGCEVASGPGFVVVEAAGSRLLDSETKQVPVKKESKSGPKRSVAPLLETPQPKQARRGGGGAAAKQPPTGVVISVECGASENYKSSKCLLDLERMMWGAPLGNQLQGVWASVGCCFSRCIGRHSARELFRFLLAFLCVARFRSAHRSHVDPSGVEVQRV